MLEIERKFLVAGLPADLSHYQSFCIRQGYLSYEPEIRIRQKGDTYYLTEKSIGTLVREEKETKISARKFDEKAQTIISAFIEKTRYLIPLDSGLTAELDIYHGKLDGLTVVEVEFQTEDAAARFMKPVWFGEEITYDSRFRNMNLAKLNGTD